MPEQWIEAAAKEIRQKYIFSEDSVKRIAEQIQRHYDTAARCPNCGGTGKSEMWSCCPRCHGTGKIVPQ